MTLSSRRNFLKLSALSTVLSGAPSAFAESKARHKWKMCTTWPPQLPILQESTELFSKLLFEVTEGQLLIKVFAGGELIPPLETFDAVSNASIEMGAGASFYWQGKIEASPFFCALPFGLNAALQNTWLHESGGIELWRKLYRPHNLRPFAFGNTGAQMAGWFKKEIHTFNDIKGLKIRMPGLGGKVMSEAGANVVLMPGGELYTALERGIIDATEWVSPFHDERLGLHRAASYYYYPGWQEPGATLELIVNTKEWNLLSKELQRSIEMCAEYVNAWVLQRSEIENGPSLQRLVAEENVQLRELSKDILDQLRVVSQDVITSITASDASASEIYTSYQSFIKKLEIWNKVSNASYYSTILKQ